MAQESSLFLFLFFFFRGMGWGRLRIKIIVMWQKPFLDVSNIVTTVLKFVYMASCSTLIRSIKSVRLIITHLSRCQHILEKYLPGSVCSQFHLNWLTFFKTYVFNFIFIYHGTTEFIVSGFYYFKMKQCAKLGVDL